MVNDIRPNDNRPVKKVVKTPAKKVVEKDEPAFVPPESVHDNDTPAKTTEQGDKSKNVPTFGKDADKPKQKKLPKQLEWIKNKWGTLSKRGKIITVLVLMLVLAGSTVAAIKFWPKKPAPTAPVIIEKKVEPPKPTTEASKLTGLQVPFDFNKRPVTAVMIENSPDARPQSGLNEAGVVFEAVAEGGITRFLAIFQDSNPAYVGPVRSARPYYVRWMLSFDANFAHAGGSPQAISDIRALGVKDIDHGANGNSFDRVNNRYQPHNLYTSIDRLIAAGASRGYTSSTYTGFIRKPEKKIETPTASAIDIAISSTYYNVHYAYDTAANSYLRSEGGQAHTDEKSGKQISPKVVIALITDKSQSGIYSVYRTTGVGSALVFQDGDVINATWSKSDDKAPLLFKDGAGQDLKLNPGQTWITAVGNASSVTYAP